MNTRCEDSVGYEQVLASYHRCEDAGGLFDSFYDFFFFEVGRDPSKIRADRNGKAKTGRRWHRSSWL